MDGCRLGPADHIKRHRLMGIAAETTDFKITVFGIERIAERGRWLRWSSLEREHAFILCLTGQPIGFPARFIGALGGSADRRAIDRFPRLRAHGRYQSAARFDVQIIQSWGSAGR